MFPCNHLPVCGKVPYVDSLDVIEEYYWLKRKGTRSLPHFSFVHSKPSRTVRNLPLTIPHLIIPLPFSIRRHPPLPKIAQIIRVHQPSPHSHFMSREDQLLFMRVFEMKICNKVPRFRSFGENLRPSKVLLGLWAVSKRDEASI